MNIFEHLGLPRNHRKEGNVTQLVKFYDEVVDKHKKNKNFGVQIKKDGVCAITIIQSGEVGIFARTGRKFTNTKHIIKTISDLRLPDGVYFGELCCQQVSLEVLSGVVNPNRINELNGIQDWATRNMTMYFFDFITIDDFIKGSCSARFFVRHMVLKETLSPHILPSSLLEEGSKIALLDVHKVKDEDDINAFLKVAVDKDEEGIVIVDLEADWVAGHKGWRKMKKVRGVDYDLRCVGYEEGKGKYKGKVANLLFTWRGGKTIKVALGKGWTHEMSERMFEYIREVVTKGWRADSLAHHYCPVGKIFQVTALKESSQGNLRLAKVGELRHDKSTPDIGE